MVNFNPTRQDFIVQIMKEGGQRKTPEVKFAEPTSIRDFLSSNYADADTVLVQHKVKGFNIPCAFGTLLEVLETLEVMVEAQKEAALTTAQG